MSRARRTFPLPFVLALALALSLLGCGDDVERGQLLLAIETDMAVPKDIDKVIVDVSTPQGVAHFERMLDGTDNFTLPGTLGIVVGTAPDVEFTVTVIGALGDQPRVMRQVLTALPPKGVRVLRVALQWLCANQGSSNEWVGSDGDGGVKSTCEGKTCVMGVCQPLGFTSPNGLTELGASDYAIDKTRTCFDALSCFAAPHEEKLTFSGGSCFFEQPPGIDLSRSNFNVAVKVPAGSGDGFCGTDGCVIPLDYDPLGTGAGWWQERLRVYVPVAICDQLKALTVVWSVTCSPKRGVVPVCQNGMAPTDVPDGDSDAGVIADASVDARADAADSAFDARADGDARAPDATDARVIVDVLDAGPDRSTAADAPADASAPPPADVGPADSGIDQTEANVTPDVSVDAADERAREAAPPDAGAPAPDVADVTAEPPSPPVDAYDAGLAVPEAEVPLDASAVDGGSDAAPEAGPADGGADDSGDDSGEEAAAPLF